MGCTILYFMHFIKNMPWRVEQKIMREMWLKGCAIYNEKSDFNVIITML